MSTAAAKAKATAAKAKAAAVKQEQMSAVEVREQTAAMLTKLNYRANLEPDKARNPTMIEEAKEALKVFGNNSVRSVLCCSLNCASKDSCTPRSTRLSGLRLKSTTSSATT